jgi:hypothetical protein
MKRLLIYPGPFKSPPDWQEAHFSLGKEYLTSGNREVALREVEILRKTHSSAASILSQELSDKTGKE